jgi:hypothetical protein
MLKKLVDAKARIWGDEAHACDIQVEWSDRYGRYMYYANCESTLERCQLGDGNYEGVLNDMFYDYCVENASYMGVS